MLPFGLGPYDLENDFVLAILGAVLFLPGAIGRAGWKHLIASGLIGVISAFVTDWLVMFASPPHTPYWWIILWPASLLMFAGATEWFMARRNGPVALAWMVLACLSAGLGFSVVLFVLRYTSWLGGRVGPDISILLMAGASWVAIPFGHRLAGERGGAKRLVALALGGMSLVGCVAFFQVGVYELAKISFNDHGPFSRQVATEFLNVRGQPADYEFLWSKLEADDWSEPIGYPVGIYGDWRATAIEFLARRDRAGAANRLGKLLKRHPKPQLIDATRGLFIEQKCYDTVPIIMRYALVEGISPSPFATVGWDRHKRALEELKVPQVAKARILSAMGQLVVNEAFQARKEERPTRDMADILHVGGHFREDLTEFLGEDAGSDLLDWYELYDEVIDVVPTPLTPQLHQETNRVVNAFERYYLARGKWLKWSQEIDSRKETEPMPPCWGVVTTVDLEAEVDRYVGAVRMLVGENSDDHDDSDPDLF